MHEQVVLVCPFFIKPFRENRKTISIDKEIAPIIKHLWSKGVITLGCCQGLKDSKSLNPSIIIHENYRDDEIELIKRFIQDIDDKKHYEILQWKNELKIQ